MHILFPRIKSPETQPVSPVWGVKNNKKYLKLRAFDEKKSTF